MVLMVDPIEQSMMGTDEDGEKQVLGSSDGAKANAVAVTDLLENRRGAWEGRPRVLAVPPAQP